MGGDESKEKQFRRLFRTALDSEVAPALSAIGFDTQERGGYWLPWNGTLDFATNIREGKWNKFGSDTFDLLLTIWLIESDSRRVRWTWKPKPEPGGDWQYSSPDDMTGLGQRMIDAILRSAVPLALNDFGPPLHEQLARLAGETTPDVARAIGDGYLMNWDS